MTEGRIFNSKFQTMNGSLKMKGEAGSKTLELAFFAASFNFSQGFPVNSPFVGKALLNGFNNQFTYVS